MKRDLAAAIADLKCAKKVRCLLLYGDDLQVQRTCKSVVSSLVPEEQRGFNLERFDGRSISWAQVQASLMTPPFFPGTKLIWIENAPYFISREQKGEVGEKILQFWSEGKREQAANLLIDLLTVEGWSQEQWETLASGAAANLVKLLGANDDEGREAVESLVAFCRDRDVDLTRPRQQESQGLAESLDRGLPEWVVLLITAVQVDRRTRLYKRLDEMGAAFHLGLERDKSGRATRESLLEFITQRIRQAEKTIEPQAREMLLQRASADLWSLHQELEKLLLYVGERGAIAAEDVEAIVSDDGEGWVFDLTRAISARNPQQALAELARLTSRGEHPLKLLGAIASDARRLLAARQWMDGELRGRWRRGMSYAQFQQQMASLGNSPARNLYGDFMALQRAEQFSTKKLLAYMDGIHSADFRLKSSGVNSRLVMERLIIGMCMPERRAKPGSVPEGRALDA